MAVPKQRRGPETRGRADVQPAHGALSDSVVILGILGLTVAICVAILSSSGVLGSGVWTNSAGSRVLLVADTEAWKEALSNAPGPIVVVFYSESCPSCKRMRAPFLATSRAISDVTFVAVDATRMDELSAEFKIEFVPTVFFLRGRQAIHANQVVYEGGTSTSKLKDFVRQQLKAVKETA